MALNNLLNYKQASAYLHLSEFTLRRYVSEKKIKHYKLGSRVFFKPEDLDAWINSKRVEAVGGTR